MNMRDLFSIVGLLVHYNHGLLHFLSSEYQQIHYKYDLVTLLFLGRDTTIKATLTERKQLSGVLLTELEIYYIIIMVGSMSACMALVQYS